MSNVVKMLTGGKTEKQSSQSTSNPVNVTPPWLQDLGKQFSASLTQFMQNQPQYQGPLAAPITQGEITGLGATAGAAYNPNRAELLDKTLQGYFLPGQAGGNPFLQSAIEAAQRPTEDALNNTLSRNLPGVFTAAGQQIGGGLRSPNANLNAGSTAFDTAAASAFTGGARALSDIATNMSYQGYNDERNRQQNAITLQQNDVNTMVTNLQAQALPRLIEQLGIDNGIKVFQDRINTLLQAFQIASGSPISQVAQQQQSTSQGKSDQYSGLINSLWPKGVGGGS